VGAFGDQLPDQLGAGALALDQHATRIEQALLLVHRAFERRVFEPSAEYSKQRSDTSRARAATLTPASECRNSRSCLIAVDLGSS
jgi:hypothetical protein